uniref:SCP domain-containing protein n=1 Tax=Brassica campestris TaxID=3711 RepID=M4FD62_BRACM
MSFSGYSFVIVSLLSIVLTQIYGSCNVDPNANPQPAATSGVRAHPQLAATSDLNTLGRTNLDPRVDLLPAETLLVHNRVRAEVGVGPMVWDFKLAAFAQNYANVRSKDCALQHSTDEMYGENIAAGWLKSKESMSGPIAAKLWYGEKKFYNYQTNKCSGMCGHYTQMVANQSHRVGCGHVRCHADTYLWVVCNYAPRPMGDENTRPY